MQENYYELLEVPKHASKKDIRRAYLAKCKQYHPDLHDGAEWAQRRLQVVNEAYNTLSDTFTRQQYDAQLISATPQTATSSTEAASAKSNSQPFKTIWWAGSLVAAVLWIAVFFVYFYESPPSVAELQQQAIVGEHIRFQQFCERHPRLIRKSEFLRVMNAKPTVGFTFQLERLLAKGDTTAIHQEIATLQPEF